MESKNVWMIFVALAGLCWGVYVPLVAQGGKELKNSYVSFLCVGAAYFLIAVIAPVAILYAKGKMPALNAPGITLASLAGVAGAVGALCVILAVGEFKGNKLFVAPVIFSLAPVINTIVSLLWHPEHGLMSFGAPEVSPGWKLYLGILFAGLGAGLVLYSKEEMEQKHAAAARPTAVVASAPVNGSTAGQQAPHVTRPAD
jgi:drug/metabolite transporter (DMT)-like permease